MGSHRAKLLLSLIDWHGFEETVGALRTLFVEYKQASISAFVGLLVDLQPSLKAGSCLLTSSSSRSEGAGVWGLSGDAPNPYIAAVLHVLGLMRGLAPAVEPAPGSSSGSSWADQLARVLCLLQVLTPNDVSNSLAEAAGRSFAVFGESFLLKAAGTVTVTAQPAAAATAVTLSWQVHAAEVLAALPAAAATTAGKGYEMWGPLAVAVSAGVATAAGGAGMLPVLQLAVASSSRDSSSTSTLRGNSLAMHLPDMLLQLQTEGLLTCGVHFTSSSSVGGSYPSSSSTDVPAAACINLQLVLLLQQLHQTDKVLTLLQALQALVTLAPTLGKTLPQAVVYVFGHPKARGYGANAGPDTAAAIASMEEALAAAAVPTGAAVPAAVATAGKQLSEVLAYIHELLPAAAIQRIITALAAALPWDGSSSTTTTDKMCPADTWSQQQGWQGVSCKQLISSSLLTASCAMWGFDKGTGVAHSLITMLAEAAEASGASTATAAAVPGGGSRVLQRSSRIAGAAESTHAGRAQQVLLDAASTGAGAGRSSGNSRLHADRAAAALLQAATGSNAAAAAAAATSHAAAADAALRTAAASGAAAAAAAAAKTAALSHASRAAAALHQAATGASSSSSSSSQLCEAGMNTIGNSSHAQRSQHALLWAAASAGSSSIGSHANRAQAKLLAAADAATGGSAVLWALQQLRAAAEQCNQDSSMGLATARTAVARVLSNAADTFAVDCEGEAAAALLAALPQLLLPSQLAVQVLVQTYDVIPAAVWSEALHATTAAAAGAGSGDSSAVLQLLLALVQEVQLQLRVNVKGPAVYAEVLLAAADCVRPDSAGERAVGQLLQLMLTGEQATTAAAAAGVDAGAAASRGVPLAASAAAQLVVELSRRRTPTSSSSSDSAAAYTAEHEQAAAARQLLVVGAVAHAILQHFSSSSTSVLVNCLAGQLYQTALLPQLYLTLLLQPCVSSSQWITLVRQLVLTSGDTPHAAAALAQLCNTLKPGKALPLAAYADVLATALDIVCTDSTNAAYPEARVGLELEKQQRQQQLLAAVVAVLGTFRGMRAMHASPLGAQLLLPMFDLAAVLCYCQELLPADTAVALAAAVAHALGQLDSSSSSQQLVQLLAQLPNAVAAGLGKGAELWMPLLQQMAVAGGMSDAEEAELIAKLTAVAAAQGLAVPVRIASSDGGPGDGEVRFADPAAAAAARGAAGTVKTAAAAAAAGVTSHPVPVTAADVDDSDGLTDDSSAFDVTENALEVIAAVSLSVASTAATAALAAGYGAAGALVGLVWGAAAMTAGALAVSGSESDASSTKVESATATAAAAAKAANGDNAAAAAVSPPASPRTPLIHDATQAAAASGSSDGIHMASMGGRTKADQAAVVKPAASTSPAAAAAFGYGGSAMAAGASAAAAAAAGQGSGPGFGAGFGVLGSLAVDPDEVVKKISSHSAHMPLDEAVMQVRRFAMRLGHAF
jgi:hypothetical protein